MEACKGVSHQPDIGRIPKYVPKLNMCLKPLIGSEIHSIINICNY